MEITKIFSNNQDNERLYTVLMNDDELSLYSEFQKEFARRDYEGLTSEQAAKLKENRNQIAQKFRELRSKEKFGINNKMQWDSLPTNNGSGFHIIGSNRKTLFIPKNQGTTYKDAVKQATKFNATQNLELLSKAKEVARQDALKSAPNFLQRNKGKLAIGASLTAGALATAAYLRNKNKNKEE